MPKNKSTINLGFVGKEIGHLSSHGTELTFFVEGIHVNELLVEILRKVETKSILGMFDVEVIEEYLRAEEK